MSTTKMRCHYEVLGVENTTTASEIKTQYYKLARILHPDKNIGNEEEAEAKFKELQQAYEILSDPQERAWYDRHRDQILHGGDGTEGEEYSGGINLWPYFSGSCFAGFTDEDGGFYKVYRTVFATLAEEELRFVPDLLFPPFGNSQCDYSVVRKFYNYWGSFATSKSFAWKDLYKSNDLPNRQVRRIAEKENKKEREKAKKEFNELVKRLVAFVKRLDPRVKEESKRQKAEEEERKKREAEEKILRAAEREKAKAIAREEEFKRLEELDLTELAIELSEEEDPDKVVDVFRCEVCSKNFRSEKQWQNHEKSKKHKLALQKLKKEVSLSSELESELNQHHISKKPETEDERNSESEQNEHADQNLPEDHQNEPEENSLEKPEPDDEDNPEPYEENNPSDEANHHNSDQEDDNTDNQDQEPEAEDSESDDGDDDEGLKQFIKHKKKKKPQKPTQILEDPELHKQPEPDETESKSTPGTTTATKPRRRRRAEKPKNQQPPQNTTTQYSCGKCNKVFGTRNNLFSHLKATGHTLAK